MTDNFDINLDQFQLHDKSEGKTIDIEYSEVCTSYDYRSAVLLHEVVEKSTLVVSTRFIHRNYVIYLAKNGNFWGIRTLRKAYRMFRGDGHSAGGDNWCQDLMTSLNSYYETPNEKRSMVYCTFLEK